MRKLKKSIPNTIREQFLRLFLGTSEGVVLSYSADKEEAYNLYSSFRPSFINDLLIFLSGTKEKPYAWKWTGNPLEGLIQFHPILKSDHRYFEEGEKSSYPLIYEHISKQI